MRRSSVSVNVRPDASCSEATTRCPLSATMRPVYSDGALVGPNQTLLAVIETPPPSSGAQPARPGPSRYQTSASSADASAPAPAKTRRPRPPLVAVTTRQTTAATTAIVHATASATSQAERTSLPVPSECTSATGHD